jgi:integrase
LGIGDDNPAVGLKAFRETRRERFATDGDLADIGRWLADAEEAGTVHPGFALAVRLLALTGTRLGEVLSMEWSAVDIEAGVIRLADAKAGARVVALSAPAAALLAALAAQEGHGAFVVTGDDPAAALSWAVFRTGWRHLRAATGLADLRPHDLRHTAGTFAAQAGANAFLVRDLLGHKTVAMTGRYVQRAADPVRAVADQVAGRVAAAMEGQRAAVVRLAPAEESDDCYCQGACRSCPCAGERERIAQTVESSVHSTFLPWNAAGGPVGRTNGYPPSGDGSRCSRCNVQP